MYILLFIVIQIALQDRFICGLMCDKFGKVYKITEAYKEMRLLSTIPGFPELVGLIAVHWWKNHGD